MKAIAVVISVLLLSNLSLAGGEKVTAEQVIQTLGLKPLPDEGGYYRETYRSQTVDATATIFGLKSEKPRAISTAIYYLVTPDDFSTIHRITSDEVFHFYGGDPVEMIQIDEDGNLKRFFLGQDLLHGQRPQVVVPRGIWQALKLAKGGKWALLGTTVSPGFEFEDFELGDRSKMLNLFPQLEKDIIQYTREPQQ